MSPPQRNLSAWDSICQFLAEFLRYNKYRGADKSLASPGMEQANVSVWMARISFGALPCRGKKNLMTARVSMLLKSRASVTCFRACFLPGRAKDLSAPRYFSCFAWFPTSVRPNLTVLSADTTHLWRSSSTHNCCPLPCVPSSKFGHGIFSTPCI